MSDSEQGEQGSATPDNSTQKGGAQKSMAKARGKSRRLAMQAIYQWQMTGDNITDIKQQFYDANNMSTLDADYFSDLFSGVASSIIELDPLLEKNMPRSIESVDPVERAILRIACYEFVKRLDVPYRVVLNEAVNIAREFCAENSKSFVNAVLDKVAREVRQIEVKAEQK